MKGVKVCVEKYGKSQSHIYIIVYILECRQSHSTICVVDHHATDGCYVLRAMKQKIFVDGLCYLLQEIYGIENKNLNRVCG